VEGTSVVLTANAADNIGVIGVQFQVDAVNVGAEVFTAPYTTVWNTLPVVNGSHAVTAIARDAAGNHTTSATITVTTNQDTTLPTVRLTSPIPGTVSGTVALTSTATDNVGVVGVQFFVDGVAFGAELTSAPYTRAWSTTIVANGSHTVSVTARDAAGNHAADTVVVTVTNNTSIDVFQSTDFTYLGYYDQILVGLSSPYAQALTHRYVAGDLRFLTIENGAPSAWVYEWSLAGKNFGDVINASTNQWLDPWSNGQTLNGYWFGLWWDEPNARLWSTHAVDYTYTYIQTQIWTRTLNANGTISNLKGPVGLQGIGAKRTYGGALALPASFQAVYGVGPYAVGFGGYTSLSGGGGGCSYGPAMYAIPEPSAYADNTEIPSPSFKTIMDCNSGVTQTDWYASGTPTFDRGVRANAPINYYDFGDQRQNPLTAPTDPPAPGAGWLSPAPDGLARWVWGDSYFNTGCWIEGSTKHGYVCIASLGAGKTWYGNAHLNDDSKVFELHIYDPARLGESIHGARDVWNVKPATMLPLTLPGLGIGDYAGTNHHAVAGATYDETTKRLYLFAPGAGDGGIYVNRLYVFAVNA
jgi:Bacterial Ig domain